ncbi:clarin-3 [Takifugu rubripes]|uniref:clarin-3 n=1 Tax=Takifugu rubripes TaxID=31033 RepID=UPI0000364A6E|nr:clarin-3 [Takifugu rubripes]|eukprot:XP_003961194.1 PREDICTED: clarin-3 [Takifugu rubripes]
MPSRQKTLYFLSSTLVTAISVGVLGYGLSTNWAIVTMDCARSDNNLFNGTAEVIYTFFNGTLTRDSCPSFGSRDNFEVFAMLAKIGGSSLALHSLVMSLLVLCFLFSAASILISLYNSISNPYETYMGPVGVYASSCLSACLSVLVLIVFVLNVTFTNLAEETVRNFTQAIPVELKNKSAEMQLGYYLVIPYAVLSLLAVGVTYMYDHTAYTHRREQQKPTEDAPKEIMMY